MMTEYKETPLLGKVNYNCFRCDAKPDEIYAWVCVRIPTRKDDRGVPMEYAKFSGYVCKKCRDFYHMEAFFTNVQNVDLSDL